MSMQIRKGPNVPHQVYKLFNHNDEILYIGISNNPLRRVNNHSETKQWAKDVRRIEISEWFPNRKEAARRAQKLIGTLSPIHNIRHKKGDAP